MEFADKTLTCRECSAEFTFTAGEQEFFQSRGLLNEPGRCPSCRAARRRGFSSRTEREYHDVVCDACGQETRVPFQPRGDRPVYCNDCFAKMKTER
jgi:CxxC-x17-CxxC domain-containing protein